MCNNTVGELYEDLSLRINLYFSKHKKITGLKLQSLARKTHEKFSKPKFRDDEKIEYCEECKKKTLHLFVHDCFTCVPCNERLMKEWREQNET